MLSCPWVLPTQNTKKAHLHSYAILHFFFNPPFIFMTQTQQSGISAAVELYRG